MDEDWGGGACGVNGYYVKNFRGTCAHMEVGGRSTGGWWVLSGWLEDGETKCCIYYFQKLEDGEKL